MPGGGDTGASGITLPEEDRPLPCVAALLEDGV